MIELFDKRQDILARPARLDMQNLVEISHFKDLFLKDIKQTEGSFLLEPEVEASWQRSRKMHIDPEMQELLYVLKPQEIKALVNDKKKFIRLTKLNFCTLLPLLDMPTALCIQDQDGIFLDTLDDDKLLNLNLRSGSIWREETVGTSSTSLCLEYDKIVQLAGSLHYCKALEGQLATTTPVLDAEGNRLGLISTIHHINQEVMDRKILERVLLWIKTLRYAVESQLELSKRSCTTVVDVPSTYKSNNQPMSDNNPFSSILGKSAQMQKVVHPAERFAKTNNGILITGESGTGKEVFARAIHEASGRSGPFVAINCAALPSNLIASELFGYVGGAFTGAESKGRQGKIELAMNGTLFLDEIGDMPLEVQPTFLRVLEDKRVMRLGSNKDVQVDFRLIAATNGDLYQLVQEKKFRADLYYRLVVLELALPPLRERGKDILLLANHFLKEFCLETGQRPIKLSKQVESFMLNYEWPGNVRQLKNAILYAANMCEGQEIRPENLPNNVYRSQPMPQTNITPQRGQSLSSLQDMEKEMLTKTLILTGYNVSSTASILGLSKASVYRKMKDYNITP